MQMMKCKAALIEANGDMDKAVEILRKSNEGAKADDQVLRDVSMHVTARNPLVALREHLAADRVAKELEIARTQATEQGKGKPANIVEKIAEGKMKTWYAENVLVEQPFVKD